MLLESVGLDMSYLEGVNCQLILYLAKSLAEQCKHT